MKKVPATLSYLVSDEKPLPHPVLVSRQIDGLREVLRRMRAAKNASLDPIINQKLQQLAQH